MKTHILLIVFMMAGCGTALKVETQKISQIKKIAVVGFTLEQEQDNQIVITLNSKGLKTEAKRDKTDFEMAGLFTKTQEFQDPIESPHAKNSYNALVSRLRSLRGLRVFSFDELMKVSSDGRILNSEKPGLTMAGMNPVPVHVFKAEHVPLARSIEGLSHSQRDALMKKMGIDAIATALVRVSLNRHDAITIKGFSGGSYRPSATTTWKLYTIGSSDPVWIDLHAFGKSVQKGVTQMWGIASPALYSSVVAASDLSYQQLLSNYKQVSK